MDLPFSCSAFLFSCFISLIIFSTVAFGATFTFLNKCEYTVWPGVLANAGSPRLDSTGFELPQDSTRSFTALTGWSGRFWGRTGCTFPSSGPGSCRTGDCGSGETECNGSGAAPPATLAEFIILSHHYKHSLSQNIPLSLSQEQITTALATAGRLSHRRSPHSSGLRKKMWVRFV